MNTEYRPPNSDNSSAYNRLSSILSPSFVSTGPLPCPSPFLLLHIAVVNGDLDMVLYLLDKGAEVRLTFLHCLGDVITSLDVGEPAIWSSYGNVSPSGQPNRPT